MSIIGLDLEEHLQNKFSFQPAQVRFCGKSNCHETINSILQQFKISQLVALNISQSR